MEEKAPATRLHAALALMESLGDAARLRILRLLEKRELGVAELCEVLQMPQSTVSRHLKLLAERGWVHPRREGTANFYTMTGDDLAPEARRLWHWMRAQTQAWPAVAQDELRLRRVLARRAEDSKAFFDNAADQWDVLRQELYGRTFQHAALLALLPSTWTVADLGCGAGSLIVDLAPHVAKVIGVDRSTAMLRTAKQRTQGLANVELRKGDLARLPLDDASCDAAILALVLTYLADISTVLREAGRILRPGGRLVIVDLLQHDREDFRRRLGQHWPGFAPRKLTEALTQAGLQRVNVRPLTPEPEAKGPALLLAVADRSMQDFSVPAQAATRDGRIT